MCVCVYPSKRIHVAVCGPIGTKFGTHMQIHLEKVVGKNKNLPRVTPGGIWGFLGGQKFKNLEKLPNGWTNWHQIWHTCADSSGNGHRLKTVSSSRPKVGTWGVLWGQKCKSQENLPNGCTDWDQIW